MLSAIVTAMRIMWGFDELGLEASRASDQRSGMTFLQSATVGAKRRVWLKGCPVDNSSGSLLAAASVPRMHEEFARQGFDLEIFIHSQGWRAGHDGVSWHAGPEPGGVCIRPGASGTFFLINGGECIDFPDEQSVVDFLRQVQLSRANDQAPPSFWGPLAPCC